MTQAMLINNSLHVYRKNYEISDLYEFILQFQKLFDKIKAKELLKEGSQGADVNEGKFVLNIDTLF
jgi:hypothetical protein